MSTVMLSNNDRTHSADKSPHFCDRDTVIKSLQEGTLSTDFQGLLHSSNPVAKCIAHGGFSIYISDLYALCPKKGQTPTINA